MANSHKKAAGSVLALPAAEPRRQRRAFVSTPIVHFPAHNVNHMIHQAHQLAEHHAALADKHWRIYRALQRLARRQERRNA